MAQRTETASNGGSIRVNVCSVNEIITARHGSLTLVTSDGRPL